MSLKLLINGARGRMGRAVVEAAGASDYEVIAETDVGSDLESVIEGCDVAVDFSVHDATLPLARLAARFGKALNEVVWQVPTVWAGNFSIGVNLLYYLTEQAAAVLPEDYNPEVLEMHHRMKKDSPSGTAERLVEILLEARRLKHDQVRHGRRGLIGERPEAEIGIHALRGGDVIGEHTVIFAGSGERIELSHKASNRTVFAQGALKAASWVAEQRAGLYDMQDVLGLKD